MTTLFAEDEPALHEPTSKENILLRLLFITLGWLLLTAAAPVKSAINVRINVDSLVVGMPSSYELLAYGWITPKQWFVVARPHNGGEKPHEYGYDYGWDWGFWIGPPHQLKYVRPRAAGMARDGGTVHVNSDTIGLYLPHPLRCEDPTFNGRPVQRVFDPHGGLTFPRYLQRTKKE